MNVYRPVFAGQSSTAFMVIAFDKKEARERIKKFLERVQDKQEYFLPEPMIDVELYPETPEGVIVL